MNLKILHFTSPILRMILDLVIDIEKKNYGYTLSQYMVTLVSKEIIKNIDQLEIYGEISVTYKRLIDFGVKNLQIGFIKNSNLFIGLNFWELSFKHNPIVDVYLRCNDFYPGDSDGIKLVFYFEK